MTMSDNIERIKALVNCRDLLASYGVRFRSGAKGNAHCWHDANHKNGDRDASMQVHPDGYNCFGCGELGDVFDVVQYFNGCDFLTAKQALAESAGIELSKQGTGGRVALFGDFADLTKPAPVERPPTVEAIRREIIGRVWDCLVFAEQPARLFEYGAARGVSEQTMRIAGVRDWTAAADDVAAVLNDYSKADWLAAGVLKVDGKPWHPFAELREIRQGIKRRASGFIVPVFDGTDSAPVALRWRYYRPGKIKSLAQPSGSPILPLGFETLTRARAGGNPYTVIVCEGETDWLAAIDAARVAGINAAVLSHCVMSTRWRPEWSAMLTGATHIVIGFDEGKGDNPAGVERARDIVNQLGTRWLDRLTIKLTREGKNDFADLHKNGELAPLIQAWTAKAEQETHNLTNEVAVQ